MKNLLELELHKKLPKETGAFVWIQIRKCPLNGDIYQDFCMDYGCQFMKDGICDHPQAEVLKEGYLNTSIEMREPRMNHKQITELTHKSGQWFQLQEDYVYSAEIFETTIPKGTKMKYIHPSISAWHFRLEKPLEPWGFKIGFGRSRLLKMKLIHLNGGQKDAKV